MSKEEGPRVFRLKDFRIISSTIKGEHGTWVKYIGPDILYILLVVFSFFRRCAGSSSPIVPQEIPVATSPVTSPVEDDERPEDLLAPGPCIDLLGIAWCSSLVHERSRGV